MEVNSWVFNPIYHNCENNWLKFWSNFSKYQVYNSQNIPNIRFTIFKIFQISGLQFSDQISKHQVYNSQTATWSPGAALPCQVRTNRSFILWYQILSYCDIKYYHIMISNINFSLISQGEIETLTILVLVSKTEIRSKKFLFSSRSWKK